MSILLSWREKVIYPLTVALMIGCCLFALAQAVERYAGSRLDLYIVTFVGMLAALQSFYTQRLVTILRLGDVKRWLVYLMELALLLVLARLGLFASDIVTGHPVSFDFFSMDLRWLMVIAMMSLAWWFARSVSIQFSRLHQSPNEGDEYIDTGWISPYDVLQSTFLWGGIGLMVGAGIARMDLSGSSVPTNPPASGVILVVLLYFGLGFILLGQARFDGVRRRWLVDHVKIANQTSTRWLYYSLILGGLAALIAFLLPVSYSLGLLDSLSTVVSIIFRIIGFLFLVLIFIISLIGRLFDQLFGGSAPTDEPVAPVDLQTLFPPSASSAGQPDWLAQIDWPSVQSALSWLIALAVIAYIGLTYLRDHPTFSQSLVRIEIFRVLARLLRAFWAAITGMAEEAGESMRDAFQRLLADSGSGRPLLGRLLRLRGSSPRERIRSLYLSALSRAAGQGIGRRSSQTPYEYEDVLGPRVPGAEGDVTEITEAFVEARYAQLPIGDEDATAAHAAWLRLRSALRRARSGGGTGSEGKK